MKSVAEYINRTNYKYAKPTQLLCKLNKVYVIGEQGSRYIVKFEYKAINEKLINIDVTINEGDNIYKELQPTIFNICETFNKNINMLNVSPDDEMVKNLNYVKHIISTEDIFNKYIEQAIQKEIESKKESKLKILEFFNISANKEIQSRVDTESTLKKLHTICNLINHNLIPHFSTVKSKYLVSNQAKDFNVFYSDVSINWKTPSIYNIRAFDIDTLHIDIKNKMYGNNYDFLLKSVSKPHDLFNKFTQARILNEINELLDVTQPLDYLRTGIFDFEVYYKDFNVSFITGAFKDIENFKNLYLSKNASKNDIDDAFKKLDVIEIANDVYKLKRLMQHTELLVGFNNSYYDNSILYALLYNLEFAHIDISQVFLPKDKIDKFSDRFTNIETVKANFHTPNEDGILLKEGSILSNLNSIIIAKDYREKNPFVKASRVKLFKEQLATLLKFIEVDVVTNKPKNKDDVITEKRTLTVEEIRNIQFAWDTGFKNLLYIDIKDEMQDNYVSLKAIEGYLGLSIEEFELFNIHRALTEEEMKESIKYCNHDVYATLLGFCHRLDFFKSKYEVMKILKLPLLELSKTRARIMSKGLQIYASLEYKDRLQLDYLDKYKDVSEETISESIAYKSFNHIKSNYDSLKKTYGENNNYKQAESKSLTYNIMGVEHNFKFGGLHGALPNILFKGNMILVDVGSYYPSLMIMYEFFTRTTPDPLLFTNVYLERMRLKQLKDKSEKVYKIALNGTFGILKDSSSSAFDALQSNNICVNGQLALVELLCRLNGKVSVVQSNTDGVYLNISNTNNLDEVYNIISEWEKDYHLKLDADKFNAIAQRDVNNYIVANIEEDGSIKKVKVKGEFKKYNHGIEIDDFKNTMRLKDQLLTEYYLYKLGAKNTRFENIGEINVDNLTKLLKEYAREDISAFQKIAKIGTYIYAVQNLEMTEQEFIQYVDKRFGIQIDNLNNIDEILKKYNYIIDSLEFDKNIQKYKIKIKINKVNRIFATKNPQFKLVEKVKFEQKDGVQVKSYAKVSDTSDNTIIYNQDLLNHDNIDELLEELDLDYEYYANFLLGKINDFGLKLVKDELHPQVTKHLWYEIQSNKIIDVPKLNNILKQNNPTLLANKTTDNKILTTLKKITTNAITGKDATFDKLVEELNIEIDIFNKNFKIKENIVEDIKEDIGNIIKTSNELLDIITTHKYNEIYENLFVFINTYLSQLEELGITIINNKIKEQIRDIVNTYNNKIDTTILENIVISDKFDIDYVSHIDYSDIVSKVEKIRNNDNKQYKKETKEKNIELLNKIDFMKINKLYIQNNFKYMRDLLANTDSMLPNKNISTLFENLYKTNIFIKAATNNELQDLYNIKILKNSKINKNLIDNIF